MAKFNKLRKKDLAKLDSQINYLIVCLQKLPNPDSGLSLGYLKGYYAYRNAYKTISLSEIEKEIERLNANRFVEPDYRTALYETDRFMQGMTTAFVQIAYRLRELNGLDLSMYDNYDPSYFEMWD